MNRKNNEDIKFTQKKFGKNAIEADSLSLAVESASPDAYKNKKQSNYPLLQNYSTQFGKADRDIKMIPQEIDILQNHSLNFEVGMKTQNEGKKFGLKKRRSHGKEPYDQLDVALNKQFNKKDQIISPQTSEIQTKNNLKINGAPRQNMILGNDNYSKWKQNESFVMEINDKKLVQPEINSFVKCDQNIEKHSVKVRNILGPVC